MADPLPDSELTIRPMVSDDVPAAWGLTVQAGWNQTPGDWRRMLEMEPGGCLAAEVDGKLVGTTVCCTFGNVAWLALVLVDVAFRDRGIGRRLVASGLRYADDRGISTVRLDATPLGRPVYERQGFHGQFELSRWGGVPVGMSMTVGQPMERSDQSDLEYLPDILALDGRATNTNREKFLRRLFTESPPRIVWKDGVQVAGYLTRRTGRLATQIGPAMGPPEAAQELLHQELQYLQGQPVIIDLPVDRTDLADIARSAGLSVQRNLLRMYRGRPLIEDRSLFQISSGGELG